MKVYEDNHLAKVYCNKCGSKFSDDVKFCRKCGSSLIDVKEEKIVKRKTVDMKPMSEEEAILQMNLLGHDFFIFKDSMTDEVSVLYKRSDEQYGIINVK